MDVLDSIRCNMPDFNGSNVRNGQMARKSSQINKPVQIRNPHNKALEFLFGSFLYPCSLTVADNAVYLHFRFLRQENMEFELRQDEDYIQLTQLLKAVGIAENGAAAAAMVTAGEVELNGVRESRKEPNSAAET